MKKKIIATTIIISGIVAGFIVWNKIKNHNEITKKSTN